MKQQFNDGGCEHLQIVVPADVEFADLHLTRNPDGTVSFHWEPIDAICEASGLRPELFRDAAPESIANLLVAWYVAHLQRGGAKDVVQEELLSNSLTEDWGAEQHTFMPGHA